VLTVREPCIEEIPTAPGHSPFRIKGVAWCETIARHEELPGGRSAVSALLPTEPLRRFYAQSFLPSGWYDVMPMLFVDAAAAKVMGVPLVEALRVGTRWQAHRVLSGIYRSFVKVMVPSAIAWAIPRLAANYFDFGAVTTQRVSVQRVRGVVAGVPVALAEWYAVTAGEFVLVALELCGCVRPSLEWEIPARSSFRDGFALVDLVFDIRWVGTREA
jgi:hypothetical protein